MSLLMDALRKAEESKKQAEQEDKKPEETGLPESQEEPVGADAPDPEVSSSSIPDTQLEFEESSDARTETETASVVESGETELSKAKKSVASESTPSAVPSEESPQESIANARDLATEKQEQQADESNNADKQAATAAKVSLSLEPMDESVRSQTRKPLDVSAAPDYSAESQLKSVGTAATKPEKATELLSSATATKSSTSGHTQQELEAAMLRASSKFAGASKARDVSGDSQSTLGPTPAEQEKTAAKEPKLDQPSVPTAKQENSTVKPRPAMGSMAGKSDASEKLESKGAPAPSKPGQAPITSEKPDTAMPGIKLQKPGQSISARSAPDRRAARSVFAAKRTGKGKRFRIRRSTKIWALQIVAVIALLGVGYVFFYSTAPTNEFNVPAEYLANASSFSDEFANEDFSDEATVAVAAGAEYEPAVEPSAAEEVIGLQDQVTTAVIGEPVNTTPAASDELAQALPDRAALGAAVNEEIVPSLGAAAVEAGLNTVQETSAGAGASADLATAANTGVANTPLAVEPETGTETGTETNAPVPAATPPGISFVRRETVSTVDPMLRQAYDAYQRGELSAAQALYQQVLEESPQQRDAMLGLAAIASSNQDAVAAMQLYSGLLARDPSDSVARAGLLALRPAGSIADQEREFRRLLAQQGNVAAVVYAVGNFYATQGRWNEAQRHYFNALQLAKADALDGIPVNPDYAFNLAVSLERINQADAAGTYYQEAISFAASHTASFDLSIARSRLASLAEVGS